MTVDVLDADSVRRTIATVSDLLTYLQGGTLGVEVGKVAGQATWTRRAKTLDGTSQQLVADDDTRCGLVVLNRLGNGQIEIDPAGGELAAGEGWPILGGDPPVIFLGAECPAGIVTVIGTSDDTITYWELT